MSDAGGGSPPLPEPEPPPQALRRPIAVIRIMARNEFRMGSKRRGSRCIGFMGLDIPILLQGISRGIFLY